MDEHTPPPPQPLCEFCHGTGETGSFKGVSRFVLTWEECPVCCGTGMQSAAPNPDPESDEED